MNSACLSTNFSMSHGHATRSTRGCSRVIHFMPLYLSSRAQSPRKHRADVAPLSAAHRRLCLRRGRYAIINGVGAGIRQPVDSQGASLRMARPLHVVWGGERAVSYLRGVVSLSL